MKNLETEVIQNHPGRARRWHMPLQEKGKKAKSRHKIHILGCEQLKMQRVARRQDLWATLTSPKEHRR